MRELSPNLSVILPRGGTNYMVSFFLSTVNISSFYQPDCALVCSTGLALLTLSEQQVTELSVVFLGTGTKQLNILTSYI